MTTTLARLPRAIRTLGFAPLAVLAAALAMAGCVTKETYTAQVNRTTNLQRLLAEEEKRSADLAVEIARLKKQAGDLEAQNKLTTTQLTEARAQVVRSLEEVGRLQEEVQKGRQSAIAGKSKSKKSLGTAPTPTEPPDRLDELQGLGRKQRLRRLRWKAVDRMSITRSNEAIRFLTLPSVTTLM